MLTKFLLKSMTTTMNNVSIIGSPSQMIHTFSMMRIASSCSLSEIWMSFSESLFLASLDFLTLSGDHHSVCQPPGAIRSDGSQNPAKRHLKTAFLPPRNGKRLLGGSKD
jgi:hypothetical protein